MVSQLGVDQNDWDAFATEITAVCRHHGIGLEGSFAYRMEDEDALFYYKIDGDGKMVRN